MNRKYHNVGGEKNWYVPAKHRNDLSLDDKAQYRRQNVTQWKKWKGNQLEEKPRN